MTWRGRLLLVVGFVIVTGWAHPPAAGVARELELGLVIAECVGTGGDGAVGICHATGVGTDPYVHIRVPQEACVLGHSHHVDDFRSDDPLCQLLPPCPGSECPPPPTIDR